MHYFRGARVELSDKNGNTPMWLAADGGHTKIVELLYRNGGAINSQDTRKVKVRLSQT